MLMKKCVGRGSLALNLPVVSIVELSKGPAELLSGKSLFLKTQLAHSCSRFLRRASSEEPKPKSKNVAGSGIV